MITLLNIGNELCYGKTVNTNASFMAEHLFAAGFDVTRIVTIRDDKRGIKSAIEEEFLQNDIILMTGGLGPTKDDITKHIIAEYFGLELIEDSTTLETVRCYFESRGLPFTEVNKMQALVPAGCTVLPNKNGTAPGLWIEKGEKLLVALPGVPFEMKPLLTDAVLPKLTARFPERKVQIHQEVLTAGIGESFLANIIEEWENNLPPHFSLAYLPSPGKVLLRLTAKGEEKEALAQEMKGQIKALKPLIIQHLVSIDNTPNIIIIKNLLNRLKAKLAVAESCTGGAIAQLITALPGASSFFEGGIVAYSNTIKREILNVREVNLKKHGAVSEMVVNDMAINSMGLFDVDYTIATSGIAGPDGGTDEKPVGMVWIAVATPTRIVSNAMQFGSSGGREVIVQKAAQTALNMLRIELMKDVKQ